MFERFTSAARSVVVGARLLAQDLDDPHIGTEHVLVALADDTGVAGQVLRDAGATAEALASALARRRGGAGRPDLDAQALRSIGIDLDEVRRAAEQTFGSGALDEPPAPGPRTRRSGHLPFTPNAKRALEQAIRHAVRLGQRHIGSEHLLLGVLDLPGGSGTRLLVDAGIDTGRLRATTLERARRSA